MEQLVDYKPLPETIEALASEGHEGGSGVQMLKELDERLAAIHAKANELVRYGGSPVGAILAFAAWAPPAGWLECNGSALSKTVYADLYAVIGDRWGSTSTHFNLPDLRGEFIRGWDHGRGVDAGRNFGSSQEGMIEEHNHGVLSCGDGGGGDPNGGRFLSGLDNNQVQSSGIRKDSVLVFGGAETRPRNVALMFCIKY